MCVAPPKIKQVGDDWVVYTTVYLTDDGRLAVEDHPLATFHGQYGEVNAQAYAAHMVAEMCGGSCTYGFSPAQVDYGQPNPYNIECG